MPIARPDLIWFTLIHKHCGVFHVDQAVSCTSEDPFLWQLHDLHVTPFTIPRKLLPLKDGAVFHFMTSVLYIEVFYCPKSTSL
jgi:hypothetical protein